MTIRFPVQLRTFDEQLQGWPAAVLRIPRTNVRRMIAEGREVDPRDFEADRHAATIYWRGKTVVPSTPLIEVEVGARLTTINSPIGVALVGAIATVAAAWLGAGTKSTSAVPRALVATCRDDLSRLKTLGEGAASPEALRTFSRATYDRCEPLMRELEDK